MRKTPIKHVVDSYKKDDGTKVRKHIKGSDTKKTTPKISSSLTKTTITIPTLEKEYLWEAIARATESNGDTRGKYGYNGRWVTEFTLDDRDEDDEPKYKAYPNGISLNFFKQTLKVGGYDDNDSNDGRMFEGMREKVKAVMKEKFPKLKYGVNSHEKGYWGVNIKN